jgi:hypothetical protein
LAANDPGNVQAQTDLVLLLYKIARVTAAEQREASIDEALLLFKRLENEGKLSPSQKAWRGQLLALRTSAPH